MKTIFFTLTLLVAMLLPDLAAAGTQRINLKIPYGSNVMVARNTSVSIMAHCIQDDATTGNDILRVYTKATDSRNNIQAQVVQSGLDTFDGNTVLDSNTPEESARLLEVSTPTGVLLIQTPTTVGGVVIDTNAKGVGIAYSAGSSFMSVGETDACHLTLSIEKINGFKKVTK